MSFQAKVTQGQYNGATGPLYGCALVMNTNICSIFQNITASFSLCMSENLYGPIDVHEPQETAYDP